MNHVFYSSPLPYDSYYFAIVVLIRYAFVRNGKIYIKCALSLNTFFPLGDFEATPAGKQSHLESPCFKGEVCQAP